jgi:hypothetical protein
MDNRPAGGLMNMGGRNIRTVWNITGGNYPGAHFATFPPELPERCIKMATSLHGVCPHCGAPWVRMTKREKIKLDDGNRTIAEVNGLSPTSVFVTGEMSIKKTIGWQPSCNCENNSPVPATVLDPFGGSGTTGQVAFELGRDAVLIELNPKYIELINERINPLLESNRMW